jgi:hypothetical protein
VVFHEAALAAPGELPGVWPLLVLGEGGRRTYANFTRSDPVAAPRALRRTGYYVFPGDAGDQLVLDGDAPAPGGHASTFGYELSVGGLRMVVDGGAGEEEGGPWAEHFCGPRAHNVVVVRGERSASDPPVSDVHWAIRGGLTCFTATRQGLSVSAPELRHRRRVICLPRRFWLVLDEVLGSGSSEAEAFVHLHPDVNLRLSCAGRPTVLASRSPAASIALGFAGPEPIRVASGVMQPALEGWHARRPGEREPAPVVSVAARGALPLALGHVIVPRPPGGVTLAVEHDQAALLATLVVGATRYELRALEGDVEMTVGASAGASRS